MISPAKERINYYAITGFWLEHITIIGLFGLTRKFGGGGGEGGSGGEYIRVE